MARRSLRTSATTTPQKNSSPASRGATSSKKPTPKKSKYFHKKREDSPASLSSSPSVEDDDDEESGYEEGGDAEDSTAAEEEEEEEEEVDEDEYASEATPPPKKKQKRSGNTAASATPKQVKGQELWRPGVKTGLGPGQQVIIDKPKARSAGKTPYKDNALHPNTMLFLEELAANNNREWLKYHDPDYRTSWNDFTSFLEQLTAKIVEEDETIPELPTKDIIFRIYRDVRFSSDPTPYKAHFSAAWSRTGRKGPFAAYYVQIKPGGQSFVGGGLWMPEAPALALLRRNIDKRPKHLKDILLDPAIRKEFLGGIAADEKKAVKAFTGHNADSALKTKPKGFEADHPDIALLRLKSFTMGRKLADDEVVGPKGLANILHIIKSMVPFITYLNKVVMPDDDASASSGSEGDEEED